MLGTSVPLVVVVASRKEIIAGSEARLARRDQRAMQRFQSQQRLPSPSIGTAIGPAAPATRGAPEAREAVTPPRDRV